MFIVFAPSNLGMKTYRRVIGPGGYKGGLHHHLKPGLQMPLYPLELLSAERENFPFLLKMPDQVCCTNVRSKKAFNELEKKEKPRKK